MKFFPAIDPAGVKTSEIIKMLKEHFDVDIFDEENLDKDFPAPEHDIISWVKAEEEADENLKNKSTDDLEKEGIKRITLRQRLMLEYIYFVITGDHLDIENITLCSGSRSSDGGVPSVNWHSGDRRLYVDWCDPDDSRGALRSRQQFNPFNLDSSKKDLLEKAEELIKKAEELKQEAEKL